MPALVVEDLHVHYGAIHAVRGVSFTVETDLRASELMMYLRRSLPVGQRFYLNDIDIATEMPPDIIRGSPVPYWVICAVMPRRAGIPRKPVAGWSR